MFNLQYAGLIRQEDPAEARNRMHLIALREARIATEYRQSLADDVQLAASQRSANLRLAARTGSGTTVDLAACCA
jgi:hypothetical protein